LVSELTPDGYSSDYRLFNDNRPLTFLWRVSSSEIWRPVVSEEHIASIFSFFHPGCHLITCWFLLKLFLPPWRWKRYIPPKHRLKLNGLHGVISQMMILFKFLWFILRCCQYLNYIASNGEFVKDPEGSGRGLIDVLSRHFPGGTNENHGNPQSEYPMSQPTVEPSTSRIQVYSVSIVSSLSVKWIIRGLDGRRPSQLKAAMVLLIYWIRPSAR
jgi:hypothetical protein